MIISPASDIHLPTSSQILDIQNRYTWASCWISKNMQQVNKIVEKQANDQICYSTADLRLTQDEDTIKGQTGLKYTTLLSSG